MIIHASKSFDKETAKFLNTMGYPKDYDMPRRQEDYNKGGIVGIAEIIDCVEKSDSYWHEEGLYGFVVVKAKPLQFYETPGRLMFFNVEMD